MHAGHAGHLWSEWGGDTSSAVGLATMGVLYAVGARRLWSHAGAGRGLRGRDVACFVAAMCVLAVALLSPVDALAGSLFSAHMTQHVLLAVAAPPLLVGSAPIVAWLWALPSSTRRSLSRAVMSSRALGRLWRAVSEPLSACAIHAVAIWTWHAPALYLAALRSPVVHFLEHASFVVTASLLWWSIMHPRRPRRAAYAIGIVVLFLTTLQSGALGALLAFSQRVWFPLQESGVARFGLTALEDQQLAGLIMWVPGGLLYVGAMAVLFAAWMRELDRNTRAGAVLA